MPKNANIANLVVQHTDALQSQIDVLHEHLKDNRELSSLLNNFTENQNVLKFLRFVKSFASTAASSNVPELKRLIVFSFNEVSGRGDNIADSTQQYINLPLSEFPSYLFQLIAHLDQLENSKPTQLPVESKITIQEFIKLIDELDKRLKAHQPTQDEGCSFLKVPDVGNMFYNLTHDDTRTSTLKDLYQTKNIKTNAAYILCYKSLCYINEKQDTYSSIPSHFSPENTKALNNIAQSIPLDSPSELSPETLQQIYAATAHHHIDTIDHIRDCFDEFKKTVLPYLEARKLLINADPGSANTFLPSDYDASKDTFDNSVKTVFERLNQLKDNAPALDNIKTALEQEEVERVALEKQKQEEAAQQKKLEEEKKAEEEKQKKLDAEKAEREALEKQKEEEKKAAEEAYKKSPEGINIANLKKLKDVIQQTTGIESSQIQFVDPPIAIHIKLPKDQWKCSLEYQARFRALAAMKSADFDIRCSANNTTLTYVIHSVTDNFINNFKTNYVNALLHEKNRLNLDSLEQAFKNLYPDTNSQQIIIPKNDDGTKKMQFQFVGQPEELPAINYALRKAGLNFQPDANDSSVFVLSNSSDIKMMDKPVFDQFIKNYKQILDFRTKLLSERTGGEKIIDWFKNHPKTTFGLSILGLLLGVIPGIVIMAIYLGGKNNTTPVDNFITAVAKREQPPFYELSSTMQGIASSTIKTLYQETPGVQEKTIEQPQPGQSNGPLSQPSFSSHQQQPQPLSATPLFNAPKHE